MFAFLQEVGRTVELVALEEDGRILAGQPFDFVVELRAGDVHHLGNARDVEIGVVELFFHQGIKLFHEGCVARGKDFRFDVFRRGDLAQLTAHFLAVLEQRFDQGEQIGRLEGLGDIGVSTLAQTFHLILNGYFGRNQNDGDMTQLQVVLDGFAEFVAASAGHYYVADNQVGRLFGHTGEGRICIEIHVHAVGGLQQDLDIVGHIDVVVHYGNEPLAGFSFCLVALRDSGKRHDFGLAFGALILGIGRCADWQDKTEDGTAFIAVPGLDIAVMECAQGARIIQSDTGSLHLLGPV